MGCSSCLNRINGAFPYLTSKSRLKGLKQKSRHLKNERNTIDKKRKGTLMQTSVTEKKSKP